MAGKFLISFFLFLLPANLFAFDGRSIYNSRISWTTEEDKHFEFENLLGFPVVIAMVYTKCQSSCPVIISFLREFKEKLGSEIKEKVRFVLVTLDQRDTVFDLKTYLKKQKLEIPNWKFLRGSEKNVKEIAAILGIKFKQMDDGEYSHSNTISLLDKDGVLVYQQLADDRNYSNMLTVLKNMIAR